jgi:hypothetical protein
MSFAQTIDLYHLRHIRAACVTLVADAGGALARRTLDAGVSLFHPDPELAFREAARKRPAA